MTRDRPQTRAALAEKRQRGERISRHPPYGYRAVGGRWLPDELEQRGLVMMRQLRAAGHSLRDVGTILHRRGFPNRAGAVLSAKVIRAVLARNP